MHAPHQLVGATADRADNAVINTGQSTLTPPTKPLLAPLGDALLTTRLAPDLKPFFCPAISLSTYQFGSSGNVWPLAIFSQFRINYQTRPVVITKPINNVVPADGYTGNPMAVSP